ncbi:MAG TPA: cupredoxin domain-containing protein [Hyphomicrobiaceae bacterium]|jgi:plastocyanin|nr:cupredoxin domain-containing protein [Hyphomicrobiaceae bacterium]
MQQSSWQVAIGTVLALGVLYSATTVSSRAQEATYSLTIHDTHFEPATLNVKAGVKFKLSVRNARKAAAEFESAELNREKVIPPGQSVIIYVGPLAPGSYPFFDDFHQSTQGRMIAK